MLNVFKKYAQQEVTKVINTASYSTFSTALENHKNKKTISKIPSKKTQENTDPQTGLIKVDCQYGSTGHAEVFDLDFKHPTNPDLLLGVRKLTTKNQAVPEAGTTELMDPVKLSDSRYDGTAGEQWIGPYKQPKLFDHKDFKDHQQSTDYVNKPDIKKKLEDICKNHQKHIKKDE